MFLNTHYISNTSSNIEFFVTPKGEKTEIMYGPSNVIRQGNKIYFECKVQQLIHVWIIHVHQ
jgi:hypothetical protein